LIIKRSITSGAILDDNKGYPAIVAIRLLRFRTCKDLNQLTANSQPERKQVCIDKGIESEMIGCIKAVDIMNRRSIQVEIRLLITEAVLTHDDHPITGDYISSVM
jgi:hypothetical protein